MHGDGREQAFEFFILLCWLCNFRFYSLIFLLWFLFTFWIATIISILFYIYEELLFFFG